ncbi:MAG: D-alanyl-D-alanine carboxypeptidase [Alphaproteobacteria bacterium]|nr:D-alanyl-D-alanine carboxypeptidase [Alphaproteobacteria bacterium]
MALLLISVGLPALAAKYASIVVDTGTGAILHAENPDERAYPASLTKMMTLYLVFEALKAKAITMDKLLPVSAYAAGRPPSKLGLRKGQTISVRDAIGALITKSANDVASVVAEGLGGTEARFAHMMTVRARKLGMSRTTFRNASGLPNRHQTSTVRDMARLGIALQRDFPEYYGLFATKSYDYKGQSYRNHNRLLTAYEGTDGIKTGYIRASGFNIVVSVERKGRRLIGVMIGGKSSGRRDRQIAQLLTDAFAAVFDGDNPPVQQLPALIASDDDDAGTKDMADDKSGTDEQEPGETAVASAVGDVAVGDAQEGSADAPALDEWAVQVGAFNRYAPAHLAATRAARQLPVLIGLRVVVVPSKARRGSLYRARLVGLDREKARDACRELRERKFQCLAIKHESPLTATQ